MRKLALATFILAGALAASGAHAQQSAGVVNNIDVAAVAIGGGGAGQNGTGFSGGYAVRSAPGINNQVVAGNCIQAVGVAASVMGGGGALSWAAEDDECTRRMNAQVLFNLGRGDAAYFLMRQNAAVRRAIDEADAARASGLAPAVRLGPVVGSAVVPQAVPGQSGPDMLPNVGQAGVSSAEPVAANTAAALTPPNSRLAAGPVLWSDACYGRGNVLNPRLPGCRRI